MINRIMFSLCLVLISNLLISNVASAELAQRWSELQNGRSKLEVRAAELQKYDFVLVKGFLPGIVSHYFEDFENVLTFDFSVSSLVAISPQSDNSISANSELIYKYLLRRYELNHKTQIVIGHSKGAAEVMLAVVAHPDLITKRIVEKVVSIQGSIGGSPLAVQADTICGSEFSWCHLFYKKYYNGLFSMEPEQSVSEFNVMIQGRGPELKELFKNHAYFVRSFQDPSLFDGRLIAINRILGNYKTSQKYDGLMRIEDQINNNFGCDLAVLDHVDHTSLLIPLTMLNLLQNKKREAFAQALIEEIFSANPDCRAN